MDRSVSGPDSLPHKILALLDVEREVLPHASTEQPLDLLIEQIITRFEHINDRRCIGAVLLNDAPGGALRLASAPHLPEMLAREMRAMRLDFVEDAATAPGWRGVRDRAQANGLGSFWSAPIVAGDNNLLGIFLCCRNSSAPADAEEVAQTRLVARITGLVIARYRFTRVIAEERHRFEVLNDIGSMLSSEFDMETLVQATTNAGVHLTGAAFGAFFHNVVKDGESYLLYTLSGISHDAFATLPMPRDTAIFSPTFRGEAIIRSDDITRDTRYGLNSPFNGLPPGHPPVKSYIAVPVISRTGDVLGGLLFGHPRPGVFKESAEQVLRGLAGQAAAALDNARLFGALQQELADRGEAEHKLSLALQATELGTWDYDLHTGVLDWSDECRKMFGLFEEQPVTMEDFYAALHPDDRQDVKKRFLELIDPRIRGGFDVEYRIIGIEDGKERWIAARGRALFDEQGRGVRAIGTTRDITDRKRAEEHQRLLVNELNHRVKNSLAMVNGVAAQSFRNARNIDEARDAFSARIIALAKAHDILTAENWEGANLEDVIRLTARAHDGDEGGRFHFSGPTVRLSPKRALALSMAMHELATNATKYGALSAATGQITIDWTIESAGDDRQFRLSWRESGGPAVIPPQRRGFGSRLIEYGLAAELHGVVEMLYHSEGISCTIRAPMAAIEELGS